MINRNKIQDLRTPVEKQIHQIIDATLAYFSGGGQVSRGTFVMVMGLLRDADSLLENKRLGCVSGKHRSPCYCDSGIQQCEKLVRLRRKEQFH